MIEHYKAWLTDCLSRLSPDNRYPINLRSLLDNLGISLEKRIPSSNNSKYGALFFDETHKKYHIVIYRNDEVQRPLNARERWTIAHELGHILVDQKYSCKPYLNRHYWDLEDIFDWFASRLLIPDSAISIENVKDAGTALKILYNLSNLCKVSKEAAARRIVQKIPNVIFLGANLTKNAAEEEITKIQWIAPPKNKFGINRFVHLSSDHIIGKELHKILNNSFESYKDKDYRENIGKVAFRVRHKSGLFAFLANDIKINQLNMRI